MCDGWFDVFQSAPGDEAGRNIASSAGRSARSRFQSAPGDEAGRNQGFLIPTRGEIRFQSAPGDEAGRNREQLERCPS